MIPATEIAGSLIQGWGEVNETARMAGDKGIRLSAFS
jgi:hypothetical protein